MMKSDKQQAIAAAAFAERWKGRGYEKGDSQVFWTELLTEVFGIENPSTFIRYEEQVKVGGIMNKNTSAFAVRDLQRRSV